MESDGLIGGQHEPRPEPYGPIQQLSFESILEHGADSLDEVLDTNWPPSLGHLGPQRGEVLRPNVGDDALLSERPDQQIGRRLVVGPGPGRQLPRIEQPALVVQEGVGQVYDTQGFEVRARRPPGVQVLLLILLLLERGVGIGQGTEIVQLTPNLLCAIPGGVGEESEVGSGLARFGRRGRMNGSHDDRCYADVAQR